MSGEWPPMDEDEARLYIAKVIVRCKGNLKKVAWQIGMSSRDKLYRKLYKFRLWPLVNAVRRKRAENSLLFSKKMRRR